MKDNGFTPEPNNLNSNNLKLMNSGQVNKSRAAQTIVFVVVMLLAVAVAAYSLYYKESTETSCGTLPVSFEGISGTPALADELLGYEFAIVILKTDETAFTSEMNDAVVEASATAKAGGIRTNILRLNSEHAAFDALVIQYEIEDFPAVLVLGEDSTVVILSNDITEESMMSAYKKVTSKTIDNNLAK